MSIVRFQMFQGVGGQTSTVSFTYTGPTPILADNTNNYFIPVSGLPGTYTAGKLISVEFDIEFPDWGNCGCYFSGPSTFSPSYFWSMSYASQGLNILGADLTNTVIYNSNVQLYPSVDSGSAPYTGTFNDITTNEPAGYFDTVFNGETLNGNWVIALETIVDSGILNSITLTFAV